MHDYTARLMHEARMAELRREADNDRRAREGKPGRPNRRLAERMLASLASGIAHWADRSLHRQPSDKPNPGMDASFADVTPQAE